MSYIQNASTIEELKHNVTFQFENVQGWLSVDDHEAALIKANYLVDALKKLVAAEEAAQIPTKKEFS